MTTQMQIGNRLFSFGKKTYIMGILNITPDSFSDGGRFHSLDDVLRAAQDMADAGVDLFDIGGESTRPGCHTVSAREETERILPVIRAIKQSFDIPVSVDTYKAETALLAAQAGADLINDIWGFSFETRGLENGGNLGQMPPDGVSPMAAAAAKTGLPVCLMHNRREPDYVCFEKDIMSDLEDSIKMAERAGVLRERIILDPGIGFGKTYEQNLWCINHLEEFLRFGLPVLLGASRKSVIGLSLNLPVEDRLEGTLVTTVFAAMKGCSFVRVHDVEENRRAIEVTETILRA